VGFSVGGGGDDEWKPATTGHDAGYLLPRLEPETFRKRNTITIHDMADTTNFRYFLFCGFMSAVLAAARTIDDSISIFLFATKVRQLGPNQSLPTGKKVKVKITITLEQATMGPEREQRYSSTL
jgi:hypothetical protein